MSMLYSLFILYIIFPKLDLIPLGGSAVRVTDLIFFLALVLYLQMRGFSFPAIRMARNYTIFIAFALVSLAVNSALFNLFAELNIVRLVQYLFWAYVGFEVAREVTADRFSRDMAYVALFLFIWAALEALHIVPKLGKFTGAGERITVNTSGPFEIAVIGSFLVFVTREKWSKGLSLAILILSQARVTILATIFLALRPYWRIVVPLAVLAMPILVLVPWNDYLEQTRFATFPTPMDAYNSTEWYWQHALVAPPTYNGIVDQTATLDEHLDQVDFQQISDRSFEVRAWRWMIIVKTVFSNPISALFGFGAGVWGVGVDGYFFRVLGEFGVIGSALFFWVIVTGLRDPEIDWRGKEYLISLVATALFIDIFVTDKPMSLMWFYIGLNSGAARLVAEDESEGWAPDGIEAVA